MSIRRFIRKPSIPTLTGWPEALQPVMRPLLQTIETLTGRRGEKLSQLSGTVSVNDVAERVNEIIRVLQDGSDTSVLVGGATTTPADPTPVVEEDNLPDTIIQYITQNVSNGGGYTNILVNGSMRIWQRQLTNSPGGAVGFNPPWYTADQWIFEQSASGVGSKWERSTDVPTVAEAGQKFWYSTKATVTSVTMGYPTATFRAWFYQNLESQRFARLVGNQCVLSFWIKSSVTGTYTAYVNLPLAGYVSRQSFTISAANTWEKKEIVFTAVPDVTLGNYYDYGAQVGITLAAGTTLSGGSEGSETYPGWKVNTANGSFVHPSQVNMMTTGSATFLITGADLRSGTSAGIEVPPLEVDQVWAMRYLEKSYPMDTPLGTASIDGYAVYGNDHPSSDTYALTLGVPYRVPKRIAPVYSASPGNGIVLYDLAGSTGKATRLSDSASVGYNSANPASTEMGFDLTHNLSSGEADTRRAFHWAVSDVRI